jgi:hypothetical protein
LLVNANEDCTMSWTPIGREPGFFDGADVYFHWALGAGQMDFFPCQRRDEWLPVLLRIRDVTPREFAEGLASWTSSVHVPAMYTRPVEGLQATKHCTALVKPNFLQLLKSDPRVRDRIARITLHPPLARASRPDDFASEPEAQQLGPLQGEPERGTVIIGIIDDGIAFAHERFRLATYETRVEYVWLQDGDYNPLRSPVPYGRELRKDGIDALLSDSTHAGFVDEDDFYRRARVVDFSRRDHPSVARRIAHGTHVMDIACREGFGEVPPADRRIVCVQLPRATTADTSGISVDAYVLDGIRYILDRADAIARERECGRLPVVINFSYGHVAGPHDGTLDLEQAIDELVCARAGTRDGKQENTLAVVLPSGNSHLSRLHARVTSQPGKTEELYWRVLPDDRTPSFMEIWLPHRNQSIEGSRVRLQIVPPWGSKSEWLEETPGEGLQWKPNGVDVVCEARYRYVLPPTERGMFLVALQPTKRLEALPSGAPVSAVAPSGIWTIRIENLSSKQVGPIEAWIQRDDTPYGFRRRGRQSYFDQPCYVRVDTQGREIEEDAQQPPCHVKRAGSINAIATGRKTIVVGGFLEKEGRPAGYSAGGPITRAAASDLHRHGPDAMAVSDRSVVRRGVLAAGTRSGSVVALSGTSVAAPQVTWWMAALMASSGRADRDAVAAIAQNHEAKPLAFGAPKPSRERGGAGRIRRPPGASIRG